MPLHDYYFYHGAVLRALLRGSKNNIALVTASPDYGVYAFTTNTNEFLLFIMYSASPRSDQSSCFNWYFSLTPQIAERLLRSLWRCLEEKFKYDKVAFALLCSHQCIPTKTHEVCILEEDEIWQILSRYLHRTGCLSSFSSISTTKRGKIDYDKIADQLKSIRCSSPDATSILSCITGLTSSPRSILSVRVQLCSGKSFRVIIEKTTIAIISRNRIYKLGGEEENKGDLKEVEAE